MLVIYLACIFFPKEVMEDMKQIFISNRIASLTNPTQTLAVPLGTEISIRYAPDFKPDSELILNNKDFRFEFNFGRVSRASINPGSPQGHPLWEIIMSRSRMKKENWYEDNLYTKCESIEIDCSFRATFEFPEKDISLFEQYYQYTNNINKKS